MGFDDGLADGQPQTAPADLAGRCAVHLVKAVKDVPVVGCSSMPIPWSDTLICAGARTLRGRQITTGAAVGGVFHGVLDQVAQNLSRPPGIGHHGGGATDGRRTSMSWARVIMRNSAAVPWMIGRRSALARARCAASRPRCGHVQEIAH